MGESLSKVCCCGGKEPEWRPTALGLAPSYLGGSPLEIPLEVPTTVDEVMWRNLFVEFRRKTSLETPRNRKKQTVGFANEDEQVEIACSGEEDNNADSVQPDSDANKRGSTEGRGRRGTDMMQERMRNVDTGMTADGLAKVPILTASVTNLADGKWRIHGLHVEKILNAGFQRLDRVLGTDGIDDLPIGPTGRTPLLRESLMKGLIAGQRDFKTVAMTDASAAQKDLPYLSLRQLLRLRVLNLDFASGGSSTHAAFLSTAEGLIFQRLGQKAADSNDPAEVASAKKLGRVLVLLVAAAKSVPTPPCWVCWFEDRRIFFHMGRLACTECAGIAFSDGGVLEFNDRSEPDRNTGGHRLMFNLMVNLVTTESGLREAQPETGSFNNGPQLSRNTLAGALGALKPTGNR